MSDHESVVSILQNNTRSKDPKKSDSAKEALKLKPTALYLKAQRSGVLYDDKNFNKAFSTFDLAKAQEIASKVDNSIQDASIAIGKSVKAKAAHTEDSKQYAQAMVDYYNAQEAESKLWNEFILALGHSKTKDPIIFSDDMASMGMESLRKILPAWPVRWLTELQNGNPPTGDPGKRKNAIGRMQTLLKKKGGKAEEEPIGLDDENTPEEEAKTRKANRTMAGKPAAKPSTKEVEKEMEDLLAEPEEKLGFEPKPSLSRIHHYSTWSDKDLIHLATEIGLPHKDRNAARHVLTKRGVDGYPEPDYKKDHSPDPSAKDAEGNPVAAVVAATPDKKKKEAKEIEDLTEQPAKKTSGESEPTSDEINAYRKWSDEGLKRLATEKGIPRVDRNAARAMLTMRGIKGYDEPDYNGKGADDDEKEVPMSVVNATDDNDKDETNSNIPKGSMLDQITGGDGPVDRPPLYHPTHENPHPCRVCGRPKDDPCHDQTS